MHPSYCYPLICALTVVTNIQCDLYGGAEECDGQPGGDPDAGSDDCVTVCLLLMMAGDDHRVPDRGGQ